MRILLYTVALVPILGTLACDSSAADAPRPPVAESPAGEQVSAPPSRTPPADLARDEGERAKDGAIDSIREHYRRIQGQLDRGSLRADTATVTCQHTDGDFFLVRYFDGDEVLMLRTTTGVGHAFTTRRYYFAAGELVFAWTVDEQFSPVSPPEDSDELGWASEYTETRYYVRDGEVIRQLTKTYEEQSWEDNPPPTDIPNRQVDVPANTRFPDLDQLETWKGGRVDC